MPTLHSRTLELVARRPRTQTYAKIAATLQGNGSGLITANWIALFASKRLKTVDVDKVQALYELLADKPLSLA